MSPYLTLPGTGLVLEQIEVGGQPCYTDINKTAWWEAAREKRGQWHSVEIGISYILYPDKHGKLVGRQMEAVKSKTGYTFDDGSTFHQVGEDEPTRFRVSDLISCEIETQVIDGNDYLNKL